MAFINFSVTRPIGLMMGVSLILVNNPVLLCKELSAQLPISTSNTEKGRSGKNQNSDFESEKILIYKRNPIILGSFSTGKKGVTRISTRNSNLENEKELVAISHLGEISLIGKLLKMDTSIKDSQEQDVFPGQLYGFAENDNFSIFSAIRAPIEKINKTENPDASLGVVVPRRITIVKCDRANEYILKDGVQVYILSFCFSNEGLHIKCHTSPGRSLLDHFYHSLPYEVEPNCTAAMEPVQEPKKPQDPPVIAAEIHSKDMK